MRRDSTAKMETRNLESLFNPRTVSYSCSTIHGCISTDEMHARATAYLVSSVETLSVDPEPLRAAAPGLKPSVKQ